MRFDVPLVFSACLAAASSAGIPRDDQPAVASRTGAFQLLRDQIAEIEEALRHALEELAGIYNGQLPPTDPPSRAPSTLTSSTSLNTQTAANQVSSSIDGLLSTLQAATSSLAFATPAHSSSITPTKAASTTSKIESTSTSTSSSAASSTASTESMGSTNSTPSTNGTTMAATSCAGLCSQLTFPSNLAASPVSCVPYAANETITITGGQRDVTCGTTITPEIDLCRVVLTVTTSPESEVYMEVWLPDGDSTWNGRTMSTDNSGVNGCVAFDDMQYVTGMGFAAIGDNGGHNSSSFDGSWFQGSNELILDWAGRARHASVVAGKAVVNQFYDEEAAYSYYIGCSAGGWQGMKSAQAYPEDFDGIIAGSSATDFNHLQAWSGRFVQLTGTGTSDARFLTQNDWVTVQSAILAQCDAPIDGVDDGILEDPTICDFDYTVLSNSTYGLTATQVDTVRKVFTELYDAEGNLLFPALLPGSQVDAFRLGQLSGSVQAISEDWYKYAVVNDSSWDALDMDQADYAEADQLDAYHGHVSGYDGDLSAFQSAGGKLLMYHGMADPLVSEGVAQRYYLKVAQTLGIGNSGMDEFLRLFRISGMAHCGVGGISGAGAWMFGQNEAAAGASVNVIDVLQDWVERDSAPETLRGTKFWYDTESLGIQFERDHCRFPYRTTYRSGDYTQPSSWGCDLIADWQECGVGAMPRLCNVDGSFDA
ncbi:putative feruloyl esterase B-2 [Fulvia fulva]|uniref:Carboxylic ester hydrolase n=1 Tax=Passalora fulva TaxID=5499 RepID=A0A1P8YXR4_PASFU|nr:putative feruloyl esterase B-2 [Fulvia fulva]AQA29312.1 hypothetical protein 19 [Fulvia fulva]KAK4634994.1 putative feruloyl esterase B-2 [Fulvia fulva]KAK4637790.1 putative feruloyl esterase B-2 [Fulvia fulva]UJO11869.1 putative feruloyl esterase B-2 [Fulvia fulva]WPV10004.1 putative feruloyl esterase B-2 [Fulvia fulva]